jgi:hypothetical protein
VGTHCGSWPDSVGPGVKVEPEHGAAERPQGKRAAFGVQVHCPAVVPALDYRLRRRGHVAGVSRDMLFGEHRLHGAAARQPLVVRKVQQVAAHQPTHLDHGRGLAAVGDLVGAAQHVPRALRRGDQHRSREYPFGREHDTGDGTAGVQELLEPVDARSHGPELVSIGQRILRRQRQFGDVGRFRCVKHGTSPS